MPELGVCISLCVRLYTLMKEPTTTAVKCKECCPELSSFPWLWVCSVFLLVCLFVCLTVVLFPSSSEANVFPEQKPLEAEKTQLCKQTETAAKVP